MIIPMAQRMPILFTGVNRAMMLIGFLPGACWVDVGADEVRVQMSWGFRATVSRSAIRSARPYTERVWAWGVHGWRGRWLVNGSSSGLVSLEIDPPARGWVIFWPVRLRELIVSVEHPEALTSAVGVAHDPQV